MMSTPLPPIYRDIRRLLVHTEEVVRRFARYHKYTVGTDLRIRAMSMMRGVNRACFDTAQQAQHVQTLIKQLAIRLGWQTTPAKSLVMVWLVDDYKLTLQLAMEVGAFKNAAKGRAHFNQFEEAANLAALIGKRRKAFGRAPECGGWQQKTASRPRAQAGQPEAQDVSRNCATGAAPGSKPAATPRAHPASLSARTASMRPAGNIGAEAPPTEASPVGAGLPAIGRQVATRDASPAIAVPVSLAACHAARLKTLFAPHPDGLLSPRRVLLPQPVGAALAAIISPFDTDFAAKADPTGEDRSNESGFDERALHRLTASLRRRGIAYVAANQTGWLRHGARRRKVREWFSPDAVVS